MRFFASFCASGFDIQEITLTFRLWRNLGGTSEILKQVWYFTRFASLRVEIALRGEIQDNCQKNG